MGDDLKTQAESQFKKKQQERVREGEQARKDYEAGRQAERDKTSRLRGLRLAKEAADLVEATAKKEAKVQADRELKAARKSAPRKKKPAVPSESP